MKQFSCCLVALMLGVSPAPAQGNSDDPPTGNDCMQTDYDCQPSSLSEDDYDSMAMSVEMGRDLPALVELESLDAADALIQRFMLNARGIMAREVPIEQSKGMFCTLSHATNQKLVWLPASGLWAFVIDFKPEAELLAGGMATCMNPRGGAA
jgi:hypothetical protein